MSHLTEKSMSESDLALLGANETTPPNYVNLTIRNKRKREDEITSEFTNFKEEMKEMMSSMLAAQLHEIKKNSDTLQEIRQTNRNIENSVSFLSEKCDELTKKVQYLEQQKNEDKKYITILEDKVEELQKNARKSNLEIKNVPKLPDEKKEHLINMVLNLSEKIECPLTTSDINDIYRVRSKKDGSSNAPIVVETSSTLLRNDILQKCKAFNLKQNEKLQAKHLGHRTSENTPIYVSEHLTPKASRLLFLARDLKKAGLYKYCWTSYGSVYLRVGDNTPVIPVLSEAQVQQLSMQT